MGFIYLISLYLQLFAGSVFDLTVEIIRGRFNVSQLMIMSKEKTIFINL